MVFIASFSFQYDRFRFPVCKFTNKAHILVRETVFRMVASVPNRTFPPVAPRFQYDPFCSYFMTLFKNMSNTGSFTIFQKRTDMSIEFRFPTLIKHSVLVPSPFVCFRIPIGMHKVHHRLATAIESKSEFTLVSVRYDFTTAFHICPSEPTL